MEKSGDSKPETGYGKYLNLKLNQVENFKSINIESRKKIDYIL
jgi:hypothetical protein